MVVAPDDHTQRRDREQTPHGHAVAEHRAAGKRREHVEGNPERGQDENVNLGMAQEPKQVLPQQRATTLIGENLAGDIEALGNVEARSQVPVEKQHDCPRRQRGKGENADDRRDEQAPDRQRHPQQGHALGAQIENRRHIVQAPHREREDEERYRKQPERLSQP